MRPWILILILMLCASCTAQQRAIWREAEARHWAAKRLYAAEPKTLTTCRQSCLFQVCEWRCETY